jgi:hypothetical protein
MVEANSTRGIKREPVSTDEFIQFRQVAMLGSKLLAVAKEHPPADRGSRFLHGEKSHSAQELNQHYGTSSVPMSRKGVSGLG